MQRGRCRDQGPDPRLCCCIHCRKARSGEPVGAPAAHRLAPCAGEPAVGEFRIGQELGQLRDTDPRDGRLRHGGELVEDHALRARPLDPVVGEPAFPGAGASLELQQRQAQEILRALNGMRPEERGRAGGDQRLVAELEVVAARTVGRPEMDRGIEAFGLEIHGAQAGGEVDRHARVPRQEGRQSRREPAGAERRQDGERQRAAAGIRGQFHRGAADEVEGLRHAAAIVARGLRGDERAPLSQEKLRAELGLEVLDVAADRALAHAEFVGRGGGRAGAQHRLEGAQQGERGQVSARPGHDV